MPTTLLALKILILLLPGFLSLRISERLTLHKDKSTLEHVIDAFVFSLIIAFLYLLLSNLFPTQLTPLDKITFQEGDISFGGFNALSMFALVVLAFVVGAAHGFIAEKGWVKKWLYDLKITRRTGRVNVWMDVFYDYTNSWLRVYMDNGAVIEGWCRHFSDSAAEDKFELFLEEVRVFREQKWDDEVFKQYSRQILLTNRSLIRMIEFLEERKVEEKKESKDE